MFFEQYSHEQFIAVARFLAMHRDVPDERREAIERISKLGYDALNVMEGHVRSRDFFAGGRYSIADIALFANTHVADEGRRFAPFSRDSIVARPRPNQPHHIPITQG